jgi:hypothetical protein
VILITRVGTKTEAPTDLCARPTARFVLCLHGAPTCVCPTGSRSHCLDPYTLRQPRPAVLAPDDRASRQAPDRADGWDEFEVGSAVAEPSCVLQIVHVTWTSGRRP